MTIFSTYKCWFICETPSVLAHSVTLYYIFQTLLLPNGCLYSVDWTRDWTVGLD